MDGQMCENSQRAESMEEDSGEFHIGHLTFTAGGSLKLHTNDRVANNTNSRCVICETECMAATHQSLLDSSHARKRLYDCRVCHGKFSRKSNLKLHMRLHAIKDVYEHKVHKVRPPHRKYTTRDPKLQQQPQKTETYECWVCREKFPNIAGLIMHLKFHTEEKPYECSTCGVKFVQRAALMLHEKAHAIEKHLSCTSGASINKFITFSKLQNSFSRHLPSQVSRKAAFFQDDKGHKCGDCDAKFSKHEDLIKHELEHKSLQHECAMCSEGFSSFERLCIHRELHIDVPLELKDLSLNS